MARNRYIKSRSNYTIKQLHQSTNIGNVYERDFMTISELNSYAPGSLPAYGLNGFKMVVDDGINLKKKHQYGSWLKNESCETVSTYWSLKCMGDDEDDVLFSSSKTLLKPDYTSLNDFVYFGSAQKLVESSITYIVKHFPGELYLMDTYVDFDGRRLYNVDNPFKIDMDSIIFPDDVIDEPLRVFSETFSDYTIINGNTVGVLSWERNSMSSEMCVPNGSLLSIIDLGSPFESNTHVILYYYNINGEKRLFHNGVYLNASIRPNNKTINKFFNSLDIFQSTLLNRKTGYSITLDTPKETNAGNITYRKTYSWPKTGIGDWNLDITSSKYKDYLTHLLDIAKFYDMYYTDNMWRAMTHEAIVAYDWTLTKIDNDGRVEEYESPNSHRIKAFIQIAGRQFDELKKYIDGVSFANTVTYDEANNNPDKFLSDTLTNYGWDVRVPVPTKLSKYVTLALYPGHTMGYSVQDANYEFYRRLLLNSSAIMLAKGTKKAIEMVLSLFGYHSINYIEHAFHDVFRNGVVKTVHWSDMTESEKNQVLRNAYDITEYVYVAGEDSVAYREGASDVVRETNSLKMSYDSDENDDFQGLPVREEITTIREPIKTGIAWDDEKKEIIEGILNGYEEKEVNYLIPWFDRTKRHDKNIYFESKGGWGLTQTKTSTIPDYGDVYIETTDELKIYDEGVKHLKFQDTISDLCNIIGEYPKTNDVYYVYDISEQDKYDWGLLGDESQPTMSHYFILKDVEYDNVLGALRDKNNIPVIVEGTGEFDKERYLEFGKPKYDDPKDINGYPNILWGKYPDKKYGWKNISEEELREGTSRDAQKVFYLESIVENNLGNAPHVGGGEYDDGEEYKIFYEDLFKPAKDNEEYDYVDDASLPWTNNYDVNINFREKTIGFNLEKMIDNVKCWYFTDLSIDHDLQLLYTDDGHMYTPLGNQVSSVGDGDFVRFYEDRDDEGDDSTELFSSSQYSIMYPYNMEGGSVDDEAAANSIINTKSLYIEFFPDLQSPDSMYEFVDDIAMHYVKQIIPSTTIFKYRVPMTGWDVFCYHRTYPQSMLMSKE